MIVETPALILSTLRYGDTSRIVRLLTRSHGLQSAIAKGAARPKSRFGASLQLMSEGTAHLSIREHRDLQTMTAFDNPDLHPGLAQAIPRFAAAAAIAEITLRHAPRETHPELFDLVTASFKALELASHEVVEALGLRLIWTLVSALGFAPALDACVRDGLPVPAARDVPFSAVDGGVLCENCARGASVSRLSHSDLATLAALLEPDTDLPPLDERYAHAHRRLLARFYRSHLNDGAESPAVSFWQRGAKA